MIFQGLKRIKKKKKKKKKKMGLQPLEPEKAPVNSKNRCF